MSRPMNKTPAWQWPVVVFWQLTASSIGRSAVNTSGLGCDSPWSRKFANPFLEQRRISASDRIMPASPFGFCRTVVGDREHLLAGIGGCCFVTTNMFGSDVGAASTDSRKLVAVPPARCHSPGPTPSGPVDGGVDFGVSAVCWAASASHASGRRACWAASALLAPTGNAPTLLAWAAAALLAASVAVDLRSGLSTVQYSATARAVSTATAATAGTNHAGSS